jgi:hypothetical protein
MADQIPALLDHYPFLSFVKYGRNEYIGIVQNVDDTVTSIYDYGALRTPQQKQDFLRLGEEWWWESSRQVPINLFIKQDWTQFKFCLKTLNTRDTDIVYGPWVSMREMVTRRSKRRSITLVRRVD